ncbi:hypothetical protein PIB30_062522 [Stylosanthes scabra]|uniref:Uncharacterized protein n=1 Tax=Stylosanthes scabra TaxID=79078 RepID=A0ABU6ZJX4_9FABA|nr:hypothetical protein [Stylosanthes scabra]
MGSGVIYYQYERREKFEDYDTKANAELGTFKISVRFDPDRPYEILSSTKDKKSSTRRSSSSRRPTPHYSPRSIPVAQRYPSVKKDESSEEDSEEDPEEEEREPEEDDNPEDGIPATPSLPMDIDAKEDYQRNIEELGRAPEYSPLRSSQAFVPDVAVEASNRQSVSRDGSSYNLSGVWQSQSSSLSS